MEPIQVFPQIGYYAWCDLNEMYQVLVIIRVYEYVGARVLPQTARALELLRADRTRKYHTDTVILSNQNCQS